MTISPFDPLRFPRYPLNNITPFSYRDGRTFLELIQALKKYINEDYVAAVNALLDELNLATEESIQGIEATFATQLTNFNTIVSGIITTTETALNAAVADFDTNTQVKYDEINAAITAMNNTVNGAIASMDENATVQIALVNTTMQQYMDDIDAQIAIINEKSGPVAIQYVTLTADYTLTPDVLFPVTHPITYVFTQNATGGWFVNPGVGVTGTVDVNLEANAQTRVTLYPVAGGWVGESSKNPTVVDDFDELILKSFAWETQSPATTIAGGTLYETFPSATRTDDGTIFVTWSRQTAHDTGGDVMVRYSTDDGVSWSSPMNISPGNGSAGIATFRGKVAVLTLVKTPANRCVVHITDTPTVQASYSPGVDISTPLYGDWRFPSDISWIDDGTTNGLILVTAYGPNGITVTSSTDGGATWAHRSTPSTTAWNVGPNEASIARTRLGDLVILMRDDSTPGPGATFSVRRSTDKGFTWDTRQVVLTAASGQPRIALMGNGVLATPVRETSDDDTDMSWAIAYSHDHGYTWEKVQVSEEMQMYGAIVPITLTKALLVGGHQASTSIAYVWTRILKLVARKPVWDTYPVRWTQSNNTTLFIEDGTLIGRKVRDGKHITGTLQFVKGANSNNGSQAYQFSLPSTPKAGTTVFGAGNLNGVTPLTVVYSGDRYIGLVLPTGRLGFDSGLVEGSNFTVGFTYEEA